MNLSWEAEERLSERQKALVGLRSTSYGIGAGNGEARGGVCLTRPRGDEHRPFGKVRVRHDEAELEKLLASGEQVNMLNTKIRAEGIVN